MADDIDIEEHDVLSHPKIQNMFPDLSLVKKEVMDEEEDFPYEDYEGFNASLHIKTEPGTSYSEPVDPVVPNKIILGTKPTTNSPMLYDPSQQLTLADLGYPDIEAFVLIENMGPTLKKSPCYCKQCQILFATVNALDAHKMTVHSFLVAVESSNKAIKSTARQQGTENALTFCNHCNTRFPDTDTLIKHMYNVMTLKCDECGVGFSNEHEKAAHQDVHLKLEENLLFRCFICKCFFVKQKYFTSHLMINHKTTPAESDFKMVEYNKKCFFCPAIFLSLRSYKHHVANKHPLLFYKHVTRGEAKYTKAPVKTIVKSMQAVKNRDNPFKCLLCKMEIKYILYHKNKFHPNLELTQMPIKRINTDAAKPALVVKQPIKEKLALQNKASENIQSKALEPSSGFVFKGKYSLNQLPVSHTFKCNKCNLHFLAAYVASQHSRSCKSIVISGQSTDDNKGFAACKLPGCGKVFRDCDIPLHEIQHSLRSNFQVITVSPKQHHYILIKCGKCCCLFGSMEFAGHMGTCDGTTTTEDCKYCDLPIHAFHLKSHEIKHVQKKLDNKKLKVIEYKLISEIESKVIPNSTMSEVKAVKSIGTVKPNDLKSYKRKLSSGGGENNPKQLKLAKVKLYVCSHCKCVLRTTKTKRMHRAAKCADQKSVICKHCGLLLTKYSTDLHYCLHTRQGYGINNFQFFDLFSSKLVPAPITKLPRCEHCGIHCGTFLSHRLHSCDKSNPKSCGYCEILIEQSGFNNHMKLHEYNEKFEKTDGITDETEEDTEEEAIETMPELLKKYQSLQSTWNILYMCEVCETCTDLYDVAVEHSQRHFSNLESYDVVMEECKVCKLTFPSACYSRHIELHKNTKIDGNSFKILVYNYTNLLSSQWLEMFKDFTGDQIKQIVSMSLYEHSRCVKLELGKEGSKDGTLYKCARCSSAILPENLSNHVVQANCIKPKLDCVTCNISFFSQKMYIQHCIYHAREPKPLRVLLFNKPEDFEFNLAMRENVAKGDNTQIANKPKPKLSYKNNKQEKLGKIIKHRDEKRKIVFRFYRCLDCGSAITMYNKMQKHVCNRLLSICAFCGLKIHKTFYKTHVRIHKTNAAFTKANFKVTDFTKSRGKVSFKATKFLASASTSISLPTKKKTYSHVNMQIQNSNTLYKCNNCDVCFLTYKSWYSHRYHKRRPSVTCEECGIRLRAAHTLHKHKEIHHQQKNLKLSDYNIEMKTECCYRDTNIPMKTLTVKNKDRPTKKITLYRCYMCPIVFETLRAMEHHMKMSLEVHNVVRKPCVSCGLVLSKKHSKSHKLYHSDLQLTPSDFLVKTNPVTQCSRCKLSFNSFYNFKRHVDKQLCSDKSIERVECHECTLTFMKTDIVQHIQLFHTILNLKTEDISVVDTVDNLDKWGLTTEPKEEVVEEKCKGKESDDVVSEDDKLELPLCEDKRTIYKCYECNLHFLSEEAVKVHMASRRKYDEIPSRCKDCGINFAKDFLTPHRQLHHKQLKLSKEDLIVKDMYVLYDCGQCSVQFQSISAYQYHLKHNHLHTTTEKCQICGYTFSTMIMARHNRLFHTLNKVKREDITIDTGRAKIIYNEGNYLIQDLDKTDEIVNIKQETIADDESITDTVATPNKLIAKVCDTEITLSESSSMDTSDVSSKANTSVSGSSPNYTKFKLKLYKCNHCNVYFLSQNTCYKHVRKHEPMDPTKYIECKSCNLQFPYMNLHIHMNRHHIQNSYDPKDILIEEYFPCVEQNPPVINIYYLKEKLQSELVSTTSEIVKDVRVPTENEKPAVETPAMIKIKTEPSEIVDSSETENLNVYKDPSPKVYKRTSKSNLGDDATPIDESLTNSETNDTSNNVENDHLTENVDNDTESSNLNGTESFPCTLCEEQFKTNRALEFHISLDHIDEASNCTICDQSFNKSILNTIHLKVSNDNFICCVCNGAFKLAELENHGQSHR